MSQLTCPRCGSEDLESYELTGHADGSVTCPYCPVEAASVDAASWTADAAAPLSPAELAAAKALARDWNLRLADGIQRMVPSDFTDEARAVVAAVRPILAAQALAWVASSSERWNGYCCHDHMAGVVMKAAEEIRAGLDTVDDAAAEAALEDYFRWEVARRLKDERDLITDHADDLEYSGRRKTKGRIKGLREAVRMLTTAIDDLSRPTSEETQ